MGRLWQGAGVLYLVTCLAGVAIGLWREATLPSLEDIPTAPLPTLRALGVAQVAFILLIYPMVTWVRAARGAVTRYGRLAVAESALCMVTAVPFYLAAGFLSDASATDVARTAVSVACVWPVAWAAGAWLVCPRPKPTVVTLALVLVAVAMPAAWYVAWDFLGAAGAVEWLWDLAPATFVYQAAGARRAGVLPRPLWAAACWPGVAGAAALLLSIRPRPRRQAASRTV